MSDPPDDWLADLRSCLTSVKGGIPLDRLESEVYALTGLKIPYKKLGHSSLEALLISSKQFTFQIRDGVTIVHAVASNKTQHLTDLIKKQKSKPPKKKPFSGSKFAPRKSNTSNSYNRQNNYSRPGNSLNRNGPSKSQGFSNYGNHRSSTAYNNSRSNQYNGYQSKTNVQNNYIKHGPLLNSCTNNTNTYHENNQSNYAESKHSGTDFLRSRLVFTTLQQSNLINDNKKNYVKSNPNSNNTVPFKLNGKTLPTTSSWSSEESTYSSSSASTPSAPATSRVDNYQAINLVNNIASQKVNINDKDQIPKNNFYMQEKTNESQQHISQAKIPYLQSMPIKPSTAQSRLSKYPKKCDEQINMVNGKETKLQIDESLADQTTDLNIDVEDPYLEVIDDKDYINELETYLNNLNLSEPYYEFMVKKEKSGKTIKLTHICTIKVNDKSVGSSFKIECSSQDYAKKVAAKQALSVLKKQYGESVIYPITNDINIMASRIKEFLKQGYQDTGLIGDVLERIYREQFQENLPENWIQLLEVYSYFKFDKLVSNQIIICLSEIENNYQNGHESSNGCIAANASVEQNIVPGTPLTLEDYNEKSVLVSANYGSANIWIRLVGQSADENFIQMQTKFNDTMNTSGFSIPEQVTEGEFYAVLYNSSWHRVQISSPVEEDGTVTCFMIDTGEQLNIAKDQICYLEPEFMKTKIQAIQCVLTNLDNFETFYGLKELLDEIILNKTFFLLPDSLEEGYVPTITLYEKSGVADRVNVNDLIIQRFLGRTIPRLPSFEENAIVDGIVSSVLESGHLNLQLNTGIVSSLEEILPNEECLYPDYFLKSKEEFEKDQVYLGYYEKENMWCRVQVVELKDEIKAQIIYIDYGNIEVCEITKLAKLDLYDPLMTKIAPQAIKVSLHLLPPSIMTSSISEKICEILGSESKVLVNVINAPTNDVPVVNLFKNLPDTPDTPLVCINMQIAQSLRKQ